MFSLTPLRKNATARRFLCPETSWTHINSLISCIELIHYFYLCCWSRKFFILGELFLSPGGERMNDPIWGVIDKAIKYFFSHQRMGYGFLHRWRSYITTTRYYYYYNQMSSDFTSSTFQRLTSITFCKDNKTQLVGLFSSMAFPDLESWLGARMRWENLLLV